MVGFQPAPRLLELPQSNILLSAVRADLTRQSLTQNLIEARSAQGRFGTLALSCAIPRLCPPQPRAEILTPARPKSRRGMPTSRGPTGYHECFASHR
jgi:hypothetical protein